MISGGVKFFDNSKSLLSDGAAVAASSGDSSGSYCVDRNRTTYWRSVGSSDAVAETVEITLPSSTTTVTRVLLLDHNFKNYSVEYNVSGVWTAFTSVIGVDGSKSGITETTYALDSSYYEVDSVTTDKIRITATETQTVDAEKYLNQVIVTTELGTLQGYPVVKQATHDRNSRNKKMVSGKMMIVKSEESFDTSLSFKNYPPSYADDLNLMVTLFERDTNFLMWLCGGKYDTAAGHFRYVLRGWRLRDVKTVQVSKPFKVGYDKNIYNNPVSFKVDFEEVVD